MVVEEEEKERSWLVRLVSPSRWLTSKAHEYYLLFKLQLLNCSCCFHFAVVL